VSKILQTQRIHDQGLERGIYSVRHAKSTTAKSICEDFLIQKWFFLRGIKLIDIYLIPLLKIQTLVENPIQINKKSTDFHWFLLFGALQWLFVKINKMATCFLLIHIVQWPNQQNFVEFGI